MLKRVIDPAQCKICGFEGPTSTASCPRCRTNYDGDFDTRQIAFGYVASIDDVLAAVTSVLKGAVYGVAVVRRVSAGLYFVGGLLKPVQVDMFMGTNLFDAARNGDVLYLSYDDGKHALLRIDDPSSVFELSPLRALIVS